MVAVGGTAHGVEVPCDLAQRLRAAGAALTPEEYVAWWLTVSKGWDPGSAPDPDCIGAAIFGAAASTVPGFDFTSFTSSWVQIVGMQNPNGGTFAETEVNLTFDSAGITNLVNQLCILGFANNGVGPNGQPACAANAGLDPTVGPSHFQGGGNFRAPGTTNSVQINIDYTNNLVQIDVDNFNPSDGLLGLIGHAGQVLLHKLTGSDNSYGCSH